MSRKCGFVEDGCDRAREALRPVIRQELETVYAERLAKAGWLQRLAIRREIKAEVERRLSELAPADALY